jgi:hypothetical protein
VGTSKSRVTTPRRKAYERAWYAANRVGVLTKCKDYRAKHREQIRAYYKTYYRKHREQVLAKEKKRRQEQPLKESTRHKIYYQKHREERLVKSKMYHARDKIEVIMAYGGICVCCGEKRIEFLAIDHINGSGNKHRRIPGVAYFYGYLKRNGFPRDLGLQVMCMNCNWAKYVYGRCPHENEKEVK